MKKAFISWSGGKDSMLALYRAIRMVDVPYLLNMLSEGGSVSRSHGLSAELLKAQAAAMGKVIVQEPSTWKGYEEAFKKVVLELKGKGITVGVFGDIELQEHRDWIERVCGDLQIEPIFPLWGIDRIELINEFISSGFRAIVVSTRAEILGEEWLGREIDWEFVKDMKAMVGVDLCGEKGEYHTFVFDGPIFLCPVGFVVGDIRREEGRLFLELSHEEKR